MLMPIFASEMKHPALLIILMCALALGSCHSRKAAVASRPAVERPKLPPVTGSTADSNDAELVARIIDGAYEWIGTPYRYGGTDRSGADCSGFLQRLFADVAAVSLPRNSRKQAEACRPVARGSLQPGDLVFFNGSRPGGDIGHVGLYIGSERMIHASSSRGVIVTDITADYYKRRYCGGGRVPAVTYAARGKRPKGEVTPVPEVRPGSAIELPAVTEVATVHDDAVIVVQSDISAKVDSAFAAIRAAEAADSIPAEGSFFD